MKKLFTLVLCGLFSSFLFSQTVNIGGTSYATIADAITAAVAGDVIEISGTHTERVNLNKAVTIRGTDPTTDIIQAAMNPGVATGRAFRVFSVGAGNVTIENLTIRHGRAAGGNGAGLFIDKATGLVTVNNVIVENNTTTRHGGGVGILGSNVNINNSTIRNNSTTVANASFGDAGGLHIVSANGAGTNTTVNVTNSTINDNTAARNGGGFLINGNNGNGDQYIVTVNFENTTIGLNMAGNFGGSGRVNAVDIVAGGGNPVGEANVVLNMNYVTIGRNTADPGDNFGLAFTNGGANPGPTFNLYNSVVVSAGLAGNRAINFANVNPGGSVINNVIGGQINMNVIVPANKVNNIFGRTAGQAGVPAALSNQGGTTQVFAITAGSDADGYIAAANGAPQLTLDQRGLVRQSPTSAGSFGLNAIPPPPPPAAVPTMGEWALFILFLLILNFGSVAILASQKQVALAGSSSMVNLKMMLQTLPFDKENFRKAIYHAFGLAVVGFVVILIFWGEIVPVDFIGMAISIPLVAYFIHLFLKK